MKAINIDLENEEVKINLWEYEKFDVADKALLRDLILWLNGKEIECPLKIWEEENE